MSPAITKHEFLRCAELKAGLEAAGVVVLENERGEIELSGETITILGVDDPSFNTDYLFGDSASVVSNTLAEISTEDDGFAVLLSHRPGCSIPMWLVAWIWLLAAMPMEGQFRLPFVGGLVALIRACSRSMILVYTPRGNTNMIVSRGIGNSILPFRFNNRPEVILIELKATPN